MGAAGQADAAAGMRDRAPWGRGVGRGRGALATGWCQAPDPTTLCGSVRSCPKLSQQKACRSGGAAGSMRPPARAGRPRPAGAAAMVPRRALRT